jgi:opacity protein-like surface antigen
MVKNLSLALAIALACAAAAPAADLDGRWSWAEAGRRGNSITVVLTLKVNGNKLTGSITGGQGRRGGAPEEIKISSGKVNGNAFSFKATQQGRGGMSMTTEYKGTLNDNDTLDLEITRPGMGPDASPQVIKVTAERSLT